MRREVDCGNHAEALADGKGKGEGEIEGYLRISTEEHVC